MWTRGTTLARLLRASALAVAVLAVSPPPARALLNPAIVVVLEEPGDGSVTTGIRLVRGYAVAPEGIDRIEWAVDGEERGRLPYGGSRGDVAAAFPTYPNSGDAGFAAAWNYALFTPGEHRIVVRAYDTRGDSNVASATFETDRFADDTFLRDGEIALDALAIRGLTATTDSGGPFRYTIELVWSQAAQQFVLQRIREESPFGLLPLNPPLDVVGALLGGGIELSWSDDGSIDYGFLVERRFRTNGAAEAWERIAIVPAGETVFLDETAALASPLAGARYEYRVRTIYSSGPGLYSEVATVNLPPA